MLSREKFVGVIPVGDTASVRSFYVAILDAGGTPLRITPVPDFSPRPFSIASWQVPDVAATVRTLVGRGVRYNRHGPDQDDLGIWSDPSGAGKVAWFEDPVGNVLSVAGPK